KVVKKGVDFVVKIGKVVYHFVETKLEQLIKALDWLWDKIKTGIMKAIEWLANFFKYKEILKTAEILEAQVLAGMDEFIKSIPAQGDIKEYFNEIRHVLEKKTGLDLDAQDMSTEDTAQDDREIDPKENFVQHHAESGTFNESAGPADEEEDSKDKDSSDDSDDDDSGKDSMADMLQYLYGKFKEGLNAFMSALAEGFLDVLEASTKAMMDPLKNAANAVRAWLADGGTQYIPVISEIYKLITGRKLKLAKALFFMLAIPVTYASKALLGKWPSELGLMDPPIGTNSSTVAIAEEDVQSSDTGAPAHLTRSLPGDNSSSEFVYTSRSGEEESAKSKRKKKVWWGLLKIASIAMSGIVIPFQAMVDVSKVPGEKRYPKGHTVFKIISLAKVIQKLLDRGASMVYIGDYFDKNKNRENKKKTVLKKGDKGLFWFTLVLEVGGTVADAASGFSEQGHPHEGGLENNPPQGGFTPAIVFNACEGLAEIAKGARLMWLAIEFGEGGFQQGLMVFQGVHGVFKGASQLA
ncbi:unnamed protein product, partial [Ectocarpus sp. 8 AP-2014]